MTNESYLLRAIVDADQDMRWAVGADNLQLTSCGPFGTEVEWVSGLCVAFEFTRTSW